MLKRIAIGSCLLLWCIACLGGCTSPNPYPLVGQIDLKENHSDYSVDSLDWNPASDLVAIGGHTATYLYSLQNTQLRELKKEPGVGNLLAWNSDGLKLAGTGRRLWIWDAQSNQLVYNTNEEDGYSYYGSIFWSRDNSLILSTLQHWNTQTSLIEAWDIETGKVASFNIANVVNPMLLDWSPDEQFLAVNELDGGPIRIADFSSGQIVHTFSDTEIPPAGWSSTGKKFVTNTTSGDLVIWDTTNWQTITTLPHQGNFARSIAWMPQGGYLVAAGDEGVIIWNVNSAVFSVVHDGRVFDAAWNLQGTRLASASGDNVYIWDVTQLP
jgi:WD40 repeat protein